MPTEIAPAETEVARLFTIQYPLSAYTFPTEVRVDCVRFDDNYLHVDLQDGRHVAVPLWWIPTLYNAAPEEREKYELNPRHTLIIWDPAKCAINEELNIADYLGPQSTPSEAPNG